MHTKIMGNKYALLAIAVVIWGGNWPVMKMALGHISPMWLATTRFASAAVISFLVLAALGRLRLPTRQEWPLVIGVGILQMGLFTALALWGLQYVPPGRASVIAYATSLWVIPLSALILKERITRSQWIAAGCCYLGMLCIIAPVLNGWAERTVVGLFMLLGASLSWGINIIQLRAKKTVKLGAEMIPWETAVASIPLLVLASAIEGAPSGFGHADVWPLLFYIGPIATALTFIVILDATQALPPVATSIAMLGVPIIGLTLSSIAFGEAISADLTIGLVLMATGVLTSALVPMLRRKAPAVVATLSPTA